MITSDTNQRRVKTLTTYHGSWTVTDKGWNTAEWEHECGARFTCHRNPETGMTREAHLLDMRRHLETCGKPATIITNIPALGARS